MRLVCSEAYAPEFDPWVFSVCEGKVEVEVPTWPVKGTGGVLWSAAACGLQPADGTT